MTEGWLGHYVKWWPLDRLFQWSPIEEACRSLPVAHIGSFGRAMKIFKDFVGSKWLSYEVQGEGCSSSKKS